MGFPAVLLDSIETELEGFEPAHKITISPVLIGFQIFVYNLMDNFYFLATGRWYHFPSVVSIKKRAPRRMPLYYINGFLAPILISSRPHKQ